MTIQTRTRILIAGLLALSSTAVLAVTPTPFTAKYQVLQGGQAIGEATLTLKSAGGGSWVYSNDVKSTGGLAAALGASSTETTRFRINQGAPETQVYDSRVNAFKTKTRHVEVDANRQVTIDEGKGPSTYAGAAGMVDRNLAPLAIGWVLRAGKQEVTLPVAVKRNVETQQFKVTGKDNVQVPAGTFQAERVERTDNDKAFSAWYVPQKYPVPVKLAQSDGGDLTLQLISYQGGK
ncbi:MAG TPA: DUF3108 domain-containing protein [Dyella sp.]|uniref:DUF3108 domain-containing protein n=1 Tax=Dyella sp. TaxID=1869338 RepID=UPI002F947C71